ncbi:MAG: hypothetical protein J0H19_24620 [Rhodospirillales bacterium]|nr:hypothetical protein [Rhodospirillales bacterium]
MRDIDWAKNFSSGLENPPGQEAAAAPVSAPIASRGAALAWTVQIVSLVISPVRSSPELNLVAD